MLIIYNNTNNNNYVFDYYDEIPFQEVRKELACENLVPSGHPLWGLPNVLMTPHCSSVYSDFDRVAAQKFSANLRRYRNGEPINNIVDPNRGY